MEAIDTDQADLESLIPASSEELPIHTGLSRQTMARLRCERKGPPFYKTGGRVFYRRGDLLEWRNACRVEPAADAAA